MFRESRARPLCSAQTEIGKQAHMSMKKVIAAVVLLAAAVAACVAVYLTLFVGTTAGSTSSNPAAALVSTMKTTASSAKTATVNAAIDASGVKTQINNALEENSASIAAATGLSQDQVDTAISNLDIEDWSATTLPATASAEDSYPISYQGTSATVTTYADPSYVTVNAAGQNVTLAVPASAQSSLDFLSYVS
jgi:hypothetical protein